MAGLRGVDPNVSFKYRKSRISLAEIIDLRHRVLRAGLPVETAHFDGDGHAQTWHVASRWLDTDDRPGGLICCASFMFVPFENRMGWQLRGMATEPSLQGQGWGKDLLNWAMQKIVEKEYVRFFWCNARQEAYRFYEKQGWEYRSKEFDIPTAGPHRKMSKIF